MLAQGKGAPIEILVKDAQQRERQRQQEVLARQGQPLPVGPPAAPRVEAADWNRSGLDSAAQGRWEQAAAEFTHALQLQPEDSQPWYRAVVLQAHLGKKAECRRLCRGMLERFGGTRDPKTARITSKACLLLAGLSEDKQRVSELADRAFTAKPTDSWSLFVKGLVEYRAGRYAEAAGWLEKALAKSRSPEVDSASCFVLAMCQQQQKQADAARVTLARAKASAALQSRENWLDWLISDLLRREAEALINK